MPQQRRAQELRFAHDAQGAGTQASLQPFLRTGGIPAEGQTFLHALCRRGPERYRTRREHRTQLFRAIQGNRRLGQVDKDVRQDTGEGRLQGPGRLHR